MCYEKRAEYASLPVSEEDFVFSREERNEAMMLTLQILEDEELLGDSIAELINR